MSEQEVEKKYRVDTFTPIRGTITRLGATPTVTLESSHYYAPLTTDDTIKMIDYGDKIEIHSLSTKNGLHSLNTVIPISTLEEGYAWFRKKGFKTLEVLNMHDEEYAYEDGGFALYTINHSVFSVILGYTAELLPMMEAEFELGNAEVIKVPYNKYMAAIGEVSTVIL
jgi:hypothetical protein